MANTKLTISSKVSKETGMSEVLIQLRCGTFSQRTKSRVFINPKFFDKSENRIVIKERRLTAEIQEAQKAKTKIDTLCNILLEQFHQTPRESIAAGWAQDIIDRFVYPERYAPTETAERTFFEIFEEYIETATFSLDRKKHFAMIERMMRRYEMYTGNDINFETFTPDLLEDFRGFLRNEHKLFTSDENGDRKPITQYKAIYESLPEFRYPVERSSNYIFGLMKMLRAFCGWAVDNKHTTQNPFSHFNIGCDTYGTPFYLTTEERDHLYESNFKYLPALERQRDVFVFQCFVGCRVGDLYMLSAQNLVSDRFGTAIEYVPQKTMDEDGRKVKVSLTDGTGHTRQIQGDIEG